MCPCIAVTSVPWVYMFTDGSVCAKPRKPAPTKLMNEQPTVHSSATRLGCVRPPFFAIENA